MGKNRKKTKHFDTDDVEQEKEMETEDIYEDKQREKARGRRNYIR